MEKEKMELDKQKFATVANRFKYNSQTEKDMEWVYNQFKPLIMMAVDTRYIRDISKFKKNTETSVKFNRFLPIDSKELNEKHYINVKELKEHQTDAFLKIIDIISSKAKINQKLCNIFNSIEWFDYSPKQNDFEGSMANIVIDDKTDNIEGYKIKEISPSQNEIKIIKGSTLFNDEKMTKAFQLMCNGVNDYDIIKELNIYHNKLKEYKKYMADHYDEILERMNY